MRMTVMLVVMLVLCAVMLFVPHHHRKPNTFKDCTLAEIYTSLFKEADWMRAPKLLTFLAFVTAGLFATLYPVVLVLMIRAVRIEDGQRGGAFFILGGLFALLGAVANVIGMLVSHMNFMTGAPSNEESAFLVIIPILQIVFAALSIAIGCSIALSHWATKVIIG